MLWHGRHLLVSALRKTRWAADQADEVLGIADLQIPVIVAVHGAGVPWGHVHTDGAAVVPARRVPELLQALPPTLGPSRSPGWPTEPACGSALPPDSQHSSAPHTQPLRVRPWPLDQRRHGALLSFD
jgi:hypothetical protein